MFVRLIVTAGAIMLATVPSPARAQCELAKIAEAVPQADANFGIQLGLYRDVLVAAQTSDGADPTDPGSAPVFRFDGTAWQPDAVFVASDAAPDDRFGTCSVHRDVILIGAYGNDDAGESSGSAYVFRYDGTGWAEETKLTARDAEADAWFGIIVSIVDDVAFVAAPRDDGAALDAGAVYVFRFDGTNWNEEAKLVASDADPGEGFGFPVALSPCGRVAIVGCYLDEHADGGVGSAYVFRYDGTNWVEEAKLIASDGSSGLFGLSCDIDRDTAIVGALLDDDMGASAGAVYTYRFDGTTWIEGPKLYAADASAGDQFGTDIALDGDRFVASAWMANGNQGTAYLFRRTGGAWAEEERLAASDGALGDGFGNVVQLHGDTIAVGARWADVGATDSGAAYVFTGALGVDHNGNGVADVCEALCPGDTDGDGDIDVSDLLIVLEGWGSCRPGR